MVLKPDWLGGAYFSHLLVLTVNDEACENDESCMILSVFGLDAADFFVVQGRRPQILNPLQLFSAHFLVP